ncbi:hexokinase [Purpureocillium lavendulum]|uniref:Hexokinase n=1 Tax=Purpureocillium lavendulum TaxID=1247861 RepID=A0AB34G466_9HYPO|nr:hexokinase [Purpureocillium lavendulum]
MSSRSSSPPPSDDDDDFQNARSASRDSSEDEGGDHTSTTDPSSIPSSQKTQKGQSQNLRQEEKPDKRDTNGGRGDDKHKENPPIAIPKIQPITPPASSASHEPPAVLARGLEGKFVDEFGNILGWDGTVLGRAEGDLPCIIGRPVDADGRIRDADGHAAGYVSENYERAPLQELGCGLTLDADGNIHDQSGAVVGKINPGPSAGASQQRSHQDGQSQQQKQSSPQPTPQPTPQPQPQPQHHETQFNIPYRNASDRPSPAPAAPSPSEIYLDVKSTHDGIQLIIKIPTVFNRDSQSQPPR